MKMMALLIEIVISMGNAADDAAADDDQISEQNLTISLHLGSISLSPSVLSSVI